jgi:hypothetical protein
MLKLASASKFSGAETLQERGSYEISGTLGRLYGSAEVEGLLIRDET